MKLVYYLGRRKSAVKRSMLGAMSVKLKLNFMVKGILSDKCIKYDEDLVQETPSIKLQMHYDRLKLYYLACLILVRQSNQI